MAVPLALIGSAGCSLDGSHQPKPAKGPARDATVAIERLERASARGDWRTVCDDIFSTSARGRAGGRDCARLLRSDAGSLARPRIDVLGIVVKGDHAEVRVRSRARGQPPLVDVIELRRERGAYRVDALSG